MADDRMKNDDLQRNMGGKEGQDFGQQSPGRTGQGGVSGGGQQGGQQGGQHAGGQQSGGQFGGQKKDVRNMEDDDLGAGGAGQTGQTGGQGRGGQNR